MNDKLTFAKWSHSEVRRFLGKSCANKTDLECVNALAKLLRAEVAAGDDEGVLIGTMLPKKDYLSRLN